jgi:hypothetical protein
MLPLPIARRAVVEVVRTARDRQAYRLLALTPPSGPSESHGHEKHGGAEDEQDDGAGRHGPQLATRAEGAPLGVFPARAQPHATIRKSCRALSGPAESKVRTELGMDGLARELAHTYEGTSTWTS